MVLEVGGQATYKPFVHASPAEIRLFLTKSIAAQCWLGLNRLREVLWLSTWLERLPLVLKVPGSNTARAQDFSPILSVYQAINDYLTLFRAEEGEGGEEKEWWPPAQLHRC